ncbi:MAG TPA: tRNA lysidine(34) synthetase TilS [Candidatus Babeliales bacterium]|jgi:tRNA(Ile)-lysidine synthase|nr:tRNA lysidine(34) synthetase TilS [Candidatus Babeliales bacterium]
MSIYTQITDFIKKHALIERNKKVVIGLSGGPDSVFLLYFLASLQKEHNLTLIAAHLNHEWRPEADQEQKDCATLAHTLNIPFVTAKRSELAATIKYNGSQEEYGRKLRRYFFEKVLQEYNADAIALAHHAQDQEETFFIRLIRGASLTGLAAMKPQHGTYIRPLLETHKSDILAWLHENNVKYATDTTNDSQDYLRNRIRMNVLPALRTCDDRFETNFITTLKRLKETEQFLEELTRTTFDSISNITANQRYINIPQLLVLNETLRNRILMHWLITENVSFPTTESFLDEITRFLQNPNGGTHAAHQKWSLVKKQKVAYIKQI